MIRIDGAYGSGSGTIVRHAVAFAALLGEAIEIERARAKRSRPGLRPQHVSAVRACAELCGAATEGVGVGSRRLRFAPRTPVRGGRFAWDIGTAGSTTMLALGVLPLACLAAGRVEARITGGVFQDFAPSPHHFARVLAPLVGRMGAQVELRVERAGYVPGGAGCIELRVEPARQPLRALRLLERGEVGRIEGIAFASHLAERDVSGRMARSCEETLAAAGLRSAIERIEDDGAVHPGASLAVWAETTTGCRLGADRAGVRGRSSESIGRFVARSLLEDLRSGATVDRHLADQLVPFAALAVGTSAFLVPGPSDHLETNLWLAGRFGATTRREGQRVEIEGLGLSPSL